MKAHSILLNEGKFRWLDVVGPTSDDLHRIAREHDLHWTSVHDSLDPEHLPKFERIGEMTFIILRAYDDRATEEADTVQELTRKVAVFYREKQLITIHRAEQPFLVSLRERWEELARSPDENAGIHLLRDIVRGAAMTYDKPIDRALDQLDRFETQIFSARGVEAFKLQQGYYLKRKASVYKRMLRMTQEVCARGQAGLMGTSPSAQDLRETIDKLVFDSEDLFESVNFLLSLDISLASQRTNEASYRANEVMRLLTVLSMFFLPLNFIAGVYGMNFEHMPELTWPHGYAYALCLMGLVAAGIYIWVRRNGWLRSD